MRETFTFNGTGAMDRRRFACSELVRWYGQRPMSEGQ